MSAPLVAILTLNWNRPADTLECLASAAAQTHPHTLLLVVDNGSSDDSVAQIAAAYPQAELICNGRNLGFAAGVNPGLRRSIERGADYVLLVNNDTTFAPDCLERLLERANADVAILSPAIYYSEAPAVPWAIGGRLNRVTYELEGDRPEQRPAALARARQAGFLELDLVPFCGVLLSRSAIEQVGWLDERFFMYYEDMDYSLRLREAGLRILMVPAASMWHKVSLSSGGRDSPNERYWMARSSVQYFRKHVRGWRWLLVAPYRTGSALKTMLRLARRGHGRSLWAYVRGLRDGLTA
jgi:GT2 family glycosyltransferase